MSVNVAMLEAMQAEGLDLGACIRVLRAGEVKRDPTAAERQARHRAKVKEEQDEVTRYVTRNEVMETPSPQSPPLKVSPDPFKNTPPLTPQPPVNQRAGDRYHRMPEGWQPTKPLPDPLQAKLDQWPPGSLADELAAFKRWAANAENKNGKGKKLDWDKAWWNWIGRRHDERYSRTNTLGRHQPSDGLSPTTRAAVAVFGAPRH